MATPAFGPFVKRVDKSLDATLGELKAEQNIINNRPEHKINGRTSGTNRCAEFHHKPCLCIHCSLFQAVGCGIWFEAAAWAGWTHGAGSETVSYDLSWFWPAECEEYLQSGVVGGEKKPRMAEDRGVRSHGSRMADADSGLGKCRLLSDSLTLRKRILMSHGIPLLDSWSAGPLPDTMILDDSRQTPILEAEEISGRPVMSCTGVVFVRRHQTAHSLSGFLVTNFVTSL